MKNGLQINPVVFKMLVLITCLMLVMLYNKSKAADVSNAGKTIQHTFIETKIICKVKR